MKRENFIRGLFVFVGGAVLAPSLVNAQGRLPARKQVREPARFWQMIAGNRVICTLCFHKCVIADGQRGTCRVRQNAGGRLYTLVYGQPAGLQSDPIELEPMYHMEPGHRNMGVFTASCNFRCKQCHNWHLSQRAPEEVRLLSFTPSEIVEEAIRRGSRSISFTINEPTIFFEYMYDTAKVARQKGVLTLFHTNGSIAPAPLRELLPYMNGVVVDLKAFSDTTYRNFFGGELEPVLDTLKIIRKEGVWLEIVNLMIPTVNDCMEQVRHMSRWIVNNLGNDVPLHFSRFQPAYRLAHLTPTPVKTLENARQVARDEGVNFSTLGNVPGHRYNSTFCPACNEMLIHRVGFAVVNNRISGGNCNRCGKAIPGIWE